VILPDALAAVLPALRCPLCHSSLSPREERAVGCEQGHAFDVARQGYLNLLVGSREVSGDTGAMIEARSAVLSAGHFAPLTQALAAAVGTAAPAGEGPALVVDAGGGTGHHLAGVLEEATDTLGLCLEVSTAALRRAARAHPRAAAVGVDVRGPLPLRDGTVAAVLSVFAPRNLAEVSRVLRPGGVLVMTVPGQGHLGELAGAVSVDPLKDDRLAARLDGWDEVAHEQVTWSMTLDGTSATAMLQMGPSGHHLSPGELAARVGAPGVPLDATGSVSVRTLRPGSAAGRSPGP
jgi:23S rRNA (guanine745-N1)-methyltransferase